VIEDLAKSASFADDLTSTSPTTKVLPNFKRLQSATSSSSIVGFFRKSIEQFVVTAKGSLPICARSKIYIPISTRLKIVGPETVPPGRKFSCVIF